MILYYACAVILSDDLHVLGQLVGRLELRL